MAPELSAIQAELQAGRTPPPISVRNFLSWFKAQRRGAGIVREIKSQLKEAGVRTAPDFQDAWIDGQVEFEMDAVSDGGGASQEAESTHSAGDDQTSAGLGGSDSTSAWVSRDPTYRVSKLKAANNIIVSVKPNWTLSQVVTEMMGKDLSQLPVMTNEREVKGIVIWQSIGSRLALNSALSEAKDVMIAHREIKSDVSIFAAISIIVEEGYVLVRAPDNRISGIITASDLSLQFRSLTEPFLLLSEIENLLRNMIGNRIGLSDLKSACDPNGGPREVKTVDDLAFGEYARLLQNPTHWEKLKLKVDRAMFCATLDRVREIRNDVMHFDPDGITDQDLETLRYFTNFLRQLNAICIQA